MDRPKIWFLSKTLLKGHPFQWLLRTEDFKKLGAAYWPVRSVCPASHYMITLYCGPYSESDAEICKNHQELKYASAV